MSVIRTASFTMIGGGPLLFGRQVFEPRGNEETHEQHEERTWTLKVPVDESGHVCINADAIKRSLEWAASWLNMKVPGGAGGKATFKKRFTAGVQPFAPTFPVSNGKTRLKPEELETQKLSVPSNGQRGGPTRVMRIFPTLYQWQCDATMLILDQSISDEVFTKHIQTAGLFDGVGSMRRGNGGPNGAYTVQGLKFEVIS